MKKEIMYVAPEAEILEAQVEKGFAVSNEDASGSGEQLIP